jgi:hypothetical protein
MLCVFLSPRLGKPRPQFADGGDGLQIWNVGAKIMNKQSRLADKGWYCSLEVGRISNIKKNSLLRNMKKCVEFGLVH